MTDTADRVMMRLAKAGKKAANETVLSTLIAGHKKGMDWVEASHEAELKAMVAALSSHGLREAVEALESYKRRADAGGNWHGTADRALAALKGEGEALKAEEQADG